MILDAITRTLEIVLGEAAATAPCDIVACYATTSGSTFTTAVTQQATAGTAPVTIIGAPRPGNQVQVNEIRVHNNDAVIHQVTLRLNDGGTIRVIQSQAVAPGGDFLYAPSAAVAAEPSAALAITLAWGSLAVAPGTFQFVGSAAYPFLIGSLDASVGGNGGTITANVGNNGSAVGGLGAVLVTLAAKTRFVASAPNALVPTGATVDVALSVTGSPVGAFLCLNGVKL